ncbi:MAG: DUF2069 domain-containing protein [Pseudomonadota bacterium]
MSLERARPGRAGSSAALWVGLWISLIALFAGMAADAWVRQAPLAIVALWYVPILIVVPGVLHDRLRSVTWLSFISLIYFVVAVERIFAEPHSLLAQIQLFAVMALFNCAMFYVRQRAREIRAQKEVISEAGLPAGAPGPEEEANKV